ncbi:hypothetical protein D9M68_562240 [compost metagenome]
MIAADTVHPAQYREMGAPAVPEKLDHRSHHGDADTGHRAERGHPRQAADGQPELPGLNTVDAPQILELEQPDGRGDHHGGQRAAGQMAQQLGGEDQQQGHAARADDATELGPCAGSLGNRCAG